MTPETYALSVGLVSLVLWYVAKVPLAWALAVACAIAVVGSTVVLGVRYSTDHALREKIRNATQDDIRLPADFMWGAATAAHQVEGGQHNDWTEMETKKGWEKSGLACDAWNLFPEDVKRMKWLGLTAFRFSVEWSRLQPERDAWDTQALAKYVGWVKLLRENGIEPIITLHHFSSPTWLVAAGGFENVSVQRTFATFCRRVAEAMRPHARKFITFNEPALYALNSCVTNARPGDRIYERPGDIAAMVRFMRNLVAAHAEAYHAIHEVYPEAQVSVAKNILYVEPRARWSPIDCFLAHEIDKAFNFAMLDAMKTGEYHVTFVSRLVASVHEKNPRWANTLDFLGLNHYNITTVGLDLANPGQPIAIAEQRLHTDNPKNQMNWEMEPSSMLSVLRKVAKYHLPILITESGCCDGDGPEDHRRQQFMLQSLACVHQAIRETINVIGFCQWSLIDNFEWDFGYGPRFGLFTVDYSTVRRQHEDRAWEQPDFEDRSRVPSGSAHLYRRVIAAHSAFASPSEEDFTWPSGSDQQRSMNDDDDERLHEKKASSSSSREKKTHVSTGAPAAVSLVATTKQKHPRRTTVVVDTTSEIEMEEDTPDSEM
jgi:beta-glucosidase